MHQLKLLFLIAKTDLLLVEPITSQRSVFLLLVLFSIDPSLEQNVRVIELFLCASAIRFGEFHRSQPRDVCNFNGKNISIFIQLIFDLKLR